MAKRTSEKELSVWQHIRQAFGLIFKNYKLFLPLILIVVVICACLVEVSKDTLVVMGVMMLLFLWLVSLFFARQILAGRKVKFFDGLYNAMTPLIATLVVLVVILIQCVPIFLLIIATSAAVETNFLSNFGYAMLFAVFAVAMIAISGFLLSDTLMALVAVSAPGMYPWRAMKLTNGVMKGKRGRFIVRLVMMALVLGLIWMIVLGPVALLATAVTLPMMLAPIVVFILGSFSVIYMAVYLYIYYRKVIHYDEK